MAILGRRKCALGGGGSGDRILAMRICHNEYSQSMGWKPDLSDPIMLAFEVQLWGTKDEAGNAKGNENLCTYRSSVFEVAALSWKMYPGLSTTYSSTDRHNWTVVIRGKKDAFSCRYRLIAMVGNSGSLACESRNRGKGYIISIISLRHIILRLHSKG